MQDQEIPVLVMGEVVVQVQQAELGLQVLVLLLVMVVLERFHRCQGLLHSTLVGVEAAHLPQVREGLGVQAAGEMVALWGHLVLAITVQTGWVAAVVEHQEIQLQIMLVATAATV